jgi:hypothetical protein
MASTGNLVNMIIFHLMKTLISDVSDDNKHETGALDSDSTKTSSHKQVFSLEIMKQALARTEVAKQVSVTSVTEKVMCGIKPIKNQVTNISSKPQD